MSRDIYHIASEYLSGRISSDDRQYFLQWLNESEENKDIFAEIEKVWKLTGSLSAMPVEPDVDDEWNRFTHLRNSDTPTVSIDIAPKRTIQLYTLRIAAVLIPMVLILSAVFFINNKNTTLQNTWVTINSGEHTLIKQLPDGTEVNMNKNTTLSYTQKFGKERLVKLKGEAFFKVTKLGKPFIVDAGNTSVKVLGTHFNVKNFGSSAQVFVEEGSVLFSAAKNDRNNAILKAGEIGLYKDESVPIEKLKTTNGNAWITKKLSFENSPLEQVKTDISNYFGQNVVLPRELSRCLFTGEFSNPNITNVLDVISISIGCKYTIRNDSVYFEGEGCN